MSSYTVYKHTFPNGKVYIGMTSQKDLNRRWGNGSGYKTQRRMARAINKYGWENVKHEIISCGLCKNDAEKLEIAKIKEYNSTDIRHGYNTDNGGNCTGTHSEETKKKISLAQMGEKNHAFGKPSKLKGKKMPPEQVEKNRKSHLGQESYWKGKNLPPETIAKMKKPKSEETKRKLSEIKSHPVICVETGIRYRSGKEAGDTLGISRGSIAWVIKGNRKTAGGYHWILANQG